MTTVAGTGSQGSTSNLLNGPFGIFVDTNFDLYVADCWNHRIQLFRLGQINGITVAGSTSPNLTISLNYPSHVILDGNKYLFITDDYNRIVGSDENGFRCIVACLGGGSTSDKLSYPRSPAFDSFGNLFVADLNNNRIQKFWLLTNLSSSQIKKQRFDIFISLFRWNNNFDINLNNFNNNNNFNINDNNNNINLNNFNSNNINNFNLNFDINLNNFNKFNNINLNNNNNNPIITLRYPHLLQQNNGSKL